MSFVVDQVRRIDAQLDRVQLRKSSYAPLSDIGESEQLSISTAQRSHTLQWAALPDAQQSSSHVANLQSAVRGLSVGNSDSRVLLKPSQIKTYLSALGQQPRSSTIASASSNAVSEREEYIKDLGWLLVSKATTQVYGHVLKSILDEAVNISDDIWYWDAVLSSQLNTGIYGIQHSPIRFWHWTRVIWEDVKSRAERFDLQDASQSASTSVRQQWTQFYGLVRQVVAERSVADLRKHVLGPVTRLRDEIRQRQANLKKFRVRNANALGVLLGEGLANESVHGAGFVSPFADDAQHRRRALIAHNVALMEAVLAKINDVDITVDKFDAAVGELTDDDPLITAARYDQETPLPAQVVAERLSRVLVMALPQYKVTTTQTVRKDGRPSRIIRYWLPLTIGLLSSSTILRLLANRQDEIIRWIEDFGTTVIDFWQNWVVEPTVKVVKTIRHDESSEVSLVSKRSLDADRASLERMVVDFAIDNPQNATGSGARLTESEITDLRTKVREGDLTPVLTAYEKDLASPLMGTVRGNLVRTLLIQVQKTKVDIEIAMGGIDALLKSQELVFGFVGLTPGILVTYFTVQWLRGSLSQKRGSNATLKQGKMLRQLRNIDRVIVNSTPTRDGELFYRDQGLLLCEVHVLRQAVEKAMPAEIYKEFCEDVDELCDVRNGVEKQKRAADRIRWAYSRYLA